MKHKNKKLDSRQIIPFVVIGLFMAVTIGHVAEYAGSFESDRWWILGIFYALAVDASIVVCSWFTRWTTTSLWAWIGYFAFTVASGGLNVAQVQPWTQENAGLQIGAWIYALFPTGSIALLGFLARDAKLLVERSNRSRGTASQKSETETQERPQSEQDNGHEPASCAWCGESFDNVQGVSAHMRWCKTYKARKESEVVAQ
jgi:hypothetical protein